MKAKLCKKIEKEITCLLTELIKINTSNPPGKETAAAEYVASYLRKSDFECEIFESAPSKGSVVTRLKGTGEKPSLLLLSHLDVVPANPKEWSVDPFSGEVKDDFVWGRGALDMKSMTAIEIIVLKLLKEEKIKLKGDVLLAATADEEKGGYAGVGYLLKNHRDKFYADYVINEGGGDAIPTAKGNLFTVQSAEKGILWFKIKVKGTSGHGSAPNMADNAIVRMNKIIQKLSNYNQKITLIPTVQRFLAEAAHHDPQLKEPLEHILSNPNQTDMVLLKMQKSSYDAAKILSQLLWPCVRKTIAPTVIQGGSKENVIPSECECIFDCRILPGQKALETLNDIKALIAEFDLTKMTFEVIQARDGSISPVETPLYETIKAVLAEFEPDCRTVPYLMTGGTDSSFYREVGSVCYGFQPMHSEPPVNGKLVRRDHGVDERISVENLVFGVNVLYETVKRFMT